MQFKRTNINPEYAENTARSMNLNPSQGAVVRAMIGTSAVEIVHGESIILFGGSFQLTSRFEGPPGTGKTTTIAAACTIWDQLQLPVWVVAHSNVAVKNIAETLSKRRVKFKLLVSKEFYEEW
jgi:regulator of nonsense transcripts 1